MNLQDALDVKELLDDIAAIDSDIRLLTRWEAVPVMSINIAAPDGYDCMWNMDIQSDYCDTNQIRRVILEELKRQLEGKLSRLGKKNIDSPV